MKETSVVAVYDSVDDAESAVHVLHLADFPANQISLIARTPQGHTAALYDLALEDDSARDAAIGAGLGGVLGVLAGVSVMSMTGLGAVFLIGPVGGGIVGAISGGFVAALSGWGIHHSQLSHYKKSLHEGRVLVIAHGNPLQVARADRILQETNNRELHIHTKTDSETADILP